MFFFSFNYVTVAEHLNTLGVVTRFQQASKIKKGDKAFEVLSLQFLLVHQCCVHLTGSAFTMSG